ncbi:MAG: sugar transferase [Bacillota bacterium]|jgi:exopolysaccharide biosynthesis polyprenyl glycosylphosphotransferase
MGSNSPKTGFNLLQMLGDLILLNLAMLLAFLLRFHGSIPQENFQPYLTFLPVISLVALLLFNFYGLYYSAGKPWSEIFASLIVSIALLTLFTIALSYMFQTYTFPRSVFFIAAFVQITVLGIWRWLLLGLEEKLTPARHVILIGPATEMELMAGKLSKKCKLLGVISEHKERENTLNVLGTYAEAVELCHLHQPDTIYMSGAVPEAVKDKITRAALSKEWQLFVIPNFYEIMLSQARLDQLQDTPVFKIGLENHPGKEQIKRLMDIAIAVLGLILTSPIFLAAAVAVKMSSSGPVFYRQKRVGKQNKCFVLLKFRTMIDGAEKKTGPVLAAENDARITPVGRFLRASRIDELPQLWNVLKGDMSIVGPRPERPYFVDQFAKEIPGYTYRHWIKAGVTGLAQIAGKYSTSPEDKLRYDLLYAKGASPLFDLQIMLQTIKVLLMREKAQ